MKTKTCLTAKYAEERRERYGTPNSPGRRSLTGLPWPPSVPSAVQGFWFLFAALFLFTPVLATAVERGIAPVPIRDQSGRQVGLYKESHALVIGVSDYTGGWPDLPGVLKDLNLVQQALERQGFNVVVVKDPDRNELIAAFEDFINRHGQTPDNRLLLYFSGHGHTLKMAYGTEMGYIVPRETPNPNLDESGFRADALSMQQMEVYAKLIQSKHALFLFDSCFSGSLFSLSRAAPRNITYKTSRPVRQFVTAGTAEERVPDESIFRRQFIEALQGEGDLDKDGYLTGLELGEFLQKTVVNYSRGSQHPQYGTIRDPDLDKGDFVFALNDPSALENNIEALERDRKNLEQERQGLADERKKLELENQLAGAKRKLEEEKRRLAEEREKLARLQPPKPEAKLSPGPAGMVKIPGGAFYAGLQGEGDNPVREMEIGTFYMDKHEVTQAEFEKVMGNNPSHFKGSNLPVESVTWHEADKYCRKAGKRLPTEWEWEKAAKGGSDTMYPWGNTMESGKANFCDVNCGYGWKESAIDDGYEGTSPVGSYPPNGYGLYDMAGNVWEWTASDNDSAGKYKVLRGGSWNNSAHASRSANRNYYDPGLHNGLYGFRCVQ